MRPFEKIRVEEVSEKLDSLGNPRTRAREIGVGIHCDYSRVFCVGKIHRSVARLGETVPAWRDNYHFGVVHRD